MKRKSRNTTSKILPLAAIGILLLVWQGMSMAGLVPKSMLSMGATRAQIFRYVKVPGAAGQFFASLRISASYSIVGAVIAEWLGGFSGLGVYMTRVRKAFAFDKMFAVIFLISGLSLLLMWGIDVLQRKCMPWEERE